MSTEAFGAGDRTSTHEHDRAEWTDWPTDSPDYPRRQLQRETWLNLNREWKVTFHPDRRPSRPTEIMEGDQTIGVPSAPETKASGSGDTWFHPAAGYPRQFELTLEPETRAVLHFGAVD